MLVGENIKRENHGRSETLFLWEGEKGKSVILLERFCVLPSRPSDRSGSQMKKLEYWDIEALDKRRTF
jgi:hypothetical protein